jgi:hypothetical protein
MLSPYPEEVPEIEKIKMRHKISQNEYIKFSN